MPSPTQSNKVWTTLKYRTPPPTPEFLQTPVPMRTEDKQVYEYRQVPVKDVRNELDRFTIESEGFEYLHDPVDIKDWSDNGEVKEVLLRETPELIKKRLGAKHVYRRIERIRRSTKNGSESDWTPLFYIHGDAVREEGYNQLQGALAGMDPAERPKNLPPTGRVLLVNVWRPLKTIKRDPLGFLVPSTVKPEDRLEQMIQGQVPATKWSGAGKVPDFWLDMVSYSEDHEWVYLKDQRVDEPVMWVVWDSRSCSVGGGKFENKSSVYHTSFQVEEYKNDEPRESMEAKYFVFFDDP